MSWGHSLRRPGAEPMIEPLITSPGPAITNYEEQPMTPEMLADPVGVVVRLVTRIEPQLDRVVIEEAVTSVAGTPHHNDQPATQTTPPPAS